MSEQKVESKTDQKSKPLSKQCLMSLDSRLVAKYVLERFGYFVDVESKRITFDGVEVSVKLNVICSHLDGQEITLLNTESKLV